MSGLQGMKEICEYARVSEATMLSWIRCENFPARKIGGIWISDKEKIDAWRKNLLDSPARDERGEYVKRKERIRPGEIQRSRHKKA